MALTGSEHGVMILSMFYSRLKNAPGTIYAGFTGAISAGCPSSLGFGGGGWLHSNFQMTPERVYAPWIACRDYERSGKRSKCCD